MAAYAYILHRREEAWNKWNNPTTQRIAIRNRINNAIKKGRENGLNKPEDVVEYLDANCDPDAMIVTAPRGRELMEQIKPGDYLFVFTIDRLSPDRATREAMYRTLLKNGIKLRLAGGPQNHRNKDFAHGAIEYCQLTEDALDAMRPEATRIRLRTEADKVQVRAAKIKQLALTKSGWEYLYTRDEWLDKVGASGPTGEYDVFLGELKRAAESRSEWLKPCPTTDQGSNNSTTGCSTTSTPASVSDSN